MHYLISSQIVRRCGKDFITSKCPWARLRRRASLCVRARPVERHHASLLTPHRFPMCVHCFPVRPGASLCVELPVPHRKACQFVNVVHLEGALSPLPPTPISLPPLLHTYSSNMSSATARKKGSSHIPKSAARDVLSSVILVIEMFDKFADVISAPALAPVMPSILELVSAMEVRCYLSHDLIKLTLAEYVYRKRDKGRNSTSTSGRASSSAKRVGLFYVLVLNICLSMAWAYNQSLFVSILSYKFHLVPYPCLQSQVHVLIVNECLMHVMVVL